jgi:hypothetical protein
MPVVGLVRTWISGLPPAFALAALILSENFRRQCVGEGALRREDFEPEFKYLLSGALVVYLAGVIILHGGLSVAYSLGWARLNAGRLPTTAVVESKTMEDVILPPNAGELALVDQDAVVASILRRDPDQPALTSYQYAVWINDGLALLREHADRNSRIFVVDWVNPFSFALELPSPRGDALYWHVERVFDQQHFPPAERVFREVTLVMVPKRAIQPASKEMLMRVYGDAVESQFEPIDESNLWILLGRRRTDL